MCVSTIEWIQEILPHVCFYYRMDSGDSTTCVFLL